jgi:hypothetical protein
MAALRKEDEGEQADQDRDAGNADDVGGLAAVGALFLAGVEQHDDEGEEDHDGAGVDDHLGGGEKLRAQEQVEHGQRAHHHDERKGAVDGVALQQEVKSSCYAEPPKKMKRTSTWSCVHATADPMLIVEHPSLTAKPCPLDGCPMFAPAYNPKGDCKPIS